MKPRTVLKFGDPESIKAIAAISEESAPIEKMRVAYGTKDKQQCGSCRHFKLESFFEVRCEIYQQIEDVRGLWQSHWEACGKWRR